VKDAELLNSVTVLPATVTKLVSTENVSREFDFSCHWNGCGLTVTAKSSWILFYFILYMYFYIYTVSQKNAPTLKRYSSEL